MNHSSDTLTVLVVEDNSAMRRIIRRALGKGEGPVEVIEAEDAAQALERAEEREIHVVLLDHRLPDRDGLDVLPEIESRTKAPIVGLSNLPDEDLEAAFLDAGAAGFLSKERGTYEQLWASLHAAATDHHMGRSPKLDREGSKTSITEDLEQIRERMRSIRDTGS